MTAEVEPHGERYYQPLLDADTRPVPESLRATSTVSADDGDIARERYFDPDFHRLEVEHMWRRVWQMACREEQIPEVGDSLVYEIVDASLIVVRTAPDEIRAFHNSCLHRGTQLRTGSGNVAGFRCPFHGFTWNLDGSFREMPCPWDFPQVDPTDFGLPEAQVGTWGGFVFVNLDPAASSLTDYLEDLPRHFAAWPLEERSITAHVVRMMPCNWKVGLEAFIEAYHTVAVHPQLLRTTGDTVTEYDIYGRHVSRMITPVGVKSEHVDREVDDAEILAAMFITADGRGHRRRRRDGAPGARRPDARLAPRRAPGATSRTSATPRPSTASSTSSSRTSCRGPGSSPRSCTASARTATIPTRRSSTSCCSNRSPTTARARHRSATRYLGEGETFADAPELGYLGRVLNQDGATFGRIQRGLHASVRPTVTLAHYQEQRIRHFHATLDAYLTGAC